MLPSRSCRPFPQSTTEKLGHKQPFADRLPVKKYAAHLAVHSIEW